MAPRPDVIPPRFLNMAAGEQFRLLRTHLQFLEMSRELRTVLVTSAGPCAGKSFVASALALVMAQNGRRTVLVDANLRTPTLHHWFHCDTTKGLTTLLEQGGPSRSFLVAGPAEQLFILPSGPTPAHPAELAGSPIMQAALSDLRQWADIVVIDSPPVLGISDTLLLTRYADGVLYVFRPRSSLRKDDRKALEQLDKSDARILGAVVNAFGHPAHRPTDAPERLLSPSASRRRRRSRSARRP